jgi:OOP family OmpA-OmpF porin
MTRLRIRADRLLWIALGASTATGAAHADATDNRFYVTPMGSYTLANHRGTNDGIGGSVAIGKRILDSLELEARGTFTDYSGRRGNADTELYSVGGGANLFPAPASDLLGGLYLHVGVLYGKAHHEPGSIHAYSTTLFEAGPGYQWTLSKQAIGPIAPGMALRLEALYRGDSHGRDLPGGALNTHRAFNEGVFNLGLHIPLGGHAVETAPAPPPPEETVQVVPVEAAPPPPEPAPEAPPAAPPCQAPEVGQPVNLSGCHSGDVIVLRGVNFDFNKASLTPNARTILDGVADALLAVPGIKVEIDGHTDGKGGAAYNQKLSQARAGSVVRYLEARGIARGRMSSKGFGKTQPIADNNTDEGREQNRRVELKIVDDGQGGAAAQPAVSAPASSADAAPATSETASPAADQAAVPTDAPADAQASPDGQSNP